MIISYKIRSLTKELPFWSAFGLWFEFQPVTFRHRSSDNLGEWTSWKIFGADYEDLCFVFVAHRRPESLKWQVPDFDEDLLTGVGARGDGCRKIDDYFETLLLMQINDSVEES